MPVGRLDDTATEVTRRLASYSPMRCLWADRLGRAGQLSEATSHISAVT